MEIKTVFEFTWLWFCAQWINEIIKRVTVNWFKQYLNLDFKDARIWHENECEQILEQRHQIKVMPIAMIDWEYKKKIFMPTGINVEFIFLNTREIILDIVLYYEHKERLVKKFLKIFLFNKSLKVK